MFSHVSIGVNDVKAARLFYDPVLAAIGHKRFYDYEDAASAYGLPKDSQVWVMTPENGEPATSGNGQMIAFLAPSRASVDAFHDAALGHGGSDEGAPGLRPHYHENYYGAYVRDPEGNKLCAVCHHPE